MRVRMKSPKTVERGCLNGSGRTSTEAKADLNAKVDAALEGTYTPTIVTYGRYAAIVYRDPSGWMYRMKELDAITSAGVHDVAYGTGYKSRAAAINGAAFHVLDIGSGAEEFHTDTDIPDWLTDAMLRDTLLGNARFRRAWLWAKENLPDIAGCPNMLHAWGCENSRDPRFA